MIGNISSVWEYIVDFAEYILFFYLMNSKAEIKSEYNKKIILAPAAIALATILFLFNHLNANPTITLFVTFIIQFLFSGIIYTTDILRLFFWNSVYILLTVLADISSVISMTYFFGATSEQLLYGGSFRYCVTLIYVILLSFFIMLVCHMNKSDIFLNIYEKILFVLLSAIYIFMGEFIYTEAFKLHINHNKLSNQLLIFCIIFLSTYILLLIFIYQLGKSRHHNIRLKEQEQLYALEKNNFLNIVEQTKELRFMKHDLSNHLAIITQMVNEKKYDELLDYLKEYNAKIEVSHQLINTGNTAIDSILTFYIHKAHMNNIDFDYMLHLPPRMPLDDVETCSLLGNICSNAIEACQKAVSDNTSDNKKAYIKLIIKPYHESLIIHSENLCNNVFKIKNNTFLTTKNDAREHGLGLKQIKSIVENSGGFMKIETPENIFKIDIVLPLTLSASR